MPRLHLTKRKAIDLGLYVVLAVLASCIVVPVLADDLGDHPAGENLLANPDFEGTYAQYGPFRTAIVAESWTPWWRPQSHANPAWQYRMPEFKAAAPYENRIHSEHNAQQLFTPYGTHAGGVYQTVTGIQPGSTLRFTLWGHAWAGSSGDPYRSEGGGPMHMAVGIDPAGGTSPFSPRVVWSREQNPLDAWAQFEIKAIAVGSAVTVFARSAPEYPTRHNDVYWDDASLMVIRPAPAPTATPRVVLSLFEPTPTAVPPTEFGPVIDTAEPTCTPAAEPEHMESATPQPTSERASAQVAPTVTPAFIVPITGAVCVTVYEDRNANRSRDDGEAVLAGARLTLASEGQVVHELITTDADEPACFHDLEARTYTLTLFAPPGYRPPAGDIWQVRLGGQDAHVLAGLRKTHQVAWTPAQQHSATSAKDEASHPFVPWFAFLLVAGTLSFIGWSLWGRR